MGIKMSLKNSLVVCDGYVKYEGAENHRSAIMKISELYIMRNLFFKWPTGGHFGFCWCEICHGLSLCKTLHYVLYSWSSYLAFFQAT